MRFVVDFAHGKYWDIIERVRRGETGYEIPLGTYRHLHVVVEAEDHDEALRKALAELDWPDAEVGLHPLNVSSQADIERALQRATHRPPPPARA